MEPAASSELSTGPWAARLALALEPLALAVRTRPGVLAARGAEHLWLRGDAAPGELVRALRCIAGLERFELIDGELLVPVGGRVPVLRLPTLEWCALRELTPLALPDSVLPGRVGRRCVLRLERAREERPVGGLLLELDAFARWCELAPAVRLQPLEFACSKPRVFVRGKPLPPLPGTYFTVTEGLACPAGWQFAPAVGAGLLAQVLGLARGDLALFLADGTWEHLPAQDFVRATRSAVRETVEACAHG